MSQTGSVPVGLGANLSSSWDGDKLDDQRKEEVTREIVGLLKTKTKLIDEVKRLIKTQQELQEAEVKFKEETTKLRAEEIARFEARKKTIIDEQLVQGRKLDAREAKLSRDLETLAEIGEYYLELADELVWESSQNDARGKELDKREHEITVGEALVEFNSAKAESLVKEAGLTLKQANKEAEFKKAESSKLFAEQIKLTTELTAKKKEFLESKTKLLAKWEYLKGLEERIVSDRKNLDFRSEQLQKSIDTIKNRV